MFRIRKILDATTSANISTINQVKIILKSQFSKIPITDIENLEEKLLNPFKYQFKTNIIVAEKNDKVVAFALVLYDPKRKFAYLDYIATAKGKHSNGLGSLLYEKVKENAIKEKCNLIAFECLPDTALLSPDDKTRLQNIARLKFYERLGITPIINTKYETPVKQDDTDPPYLMVDLIQTEALSKKYARQVVRTILENKYGNYCPQEYTEMVVASFKDDPVKMRPFQYIKKIPANTETKGLNSSTVEDPIILVVNDQHEIHHINEVGYVEAPVRVEIILKEIKKLNCFKEVAPQSFSEKYIKAVHDKSFFSFIKSVCSQIEENKSIYPYIFPIRNTAKIPRYMPIKAGYFCIDTFTPLTSNVFKAAKRAVDCALTAADAILNESSIAYALIRPPGHHAERKFFGGFCYFNNAAIAADALSKYGKVAVLDIDFHHGNGIQDIFYKRNDVLTISIHGHPATEYPYFTGFEDERGEAEGFGYNINYALPENTTPEKYLQTLKKALDKIKKFSPAFLVIALGFDTAANDPTGAWKNGEDEFRQIASQIATLKLPTLIIQEGGYLTTTIGKNAKSFFESLFKTYHN
ncbi:MAG: histone deacetylase family protein [Alphaproteobacteria bacterium]